MLRGRQALGLALGLCVAHLLVSAGWVWRIPAQEFTFHNHDLSLVLYPQVFRGENWAPELPLAELTPPSWPGYGPYDLFAGMVRNGEAGLRSYRTLAPVHYVVSSLPAVLWGVSLWTVRLGPVVVLWLLLLAALDTGRRLVRTDRAPGYHAGLLAALALTAVPVGWMGALVGTPTLGNMAGVGLALWALVASDGFRRLGWSVLAGALIALASRWGESVGDGLICLAALSGPVTLSALIALGRLLRRAELRGILGAGATALVVSNGLELTWLQYHLEDYILAEARLSSQTDLLDLIPRILANSLAYGRTLTWSLLGLAGAVVAVLGGLRLLRHAPRQPLALVVLASPLSGLLVLSVAAKGHDYYAAPVVPALMIAGGAGIALLPGRLRGLLGGWLLASWLVTAHLNTTVLEPIQCSRVVSQLLAGDPDRCEQVQPTAGDTPGGEAIYPWFRQWRRPPNLEVSRRREIGRWLTDGAGRAWLSSLPADTVVLLQVPPGPGGGSDIVQLVGQAHRPDVYFQRQPLGRPRGHRREMLTWAQDAGHPLVLMTFSKDLHIGDETPERPLRWLGSLEEGPQGPFLSIWTVQ